MTGPAPAAAAAKKPKVNMTNAWQEAHALIWAHRKQLALGTLLVLVNSAAGFVLPTSTKFLVDDVIGKHDMGLLKLITLAVIGATVVQAATSFGLSQVMSIAAQRAIADMRKRVQAHILRLPVSYFDTTQSGVLISRIMNDAEGIRNLVGTGLAQLAGGLVTGIAALIVLFVLNWKLTSVTLLFLAAFGGGMARAFAKLRPLFRERGAITAEVTGRLAQALGGVRIVKTYVAERREEVTFARGVHRLFRNIAASLTGISLVTAFSTVIIGVIGVLMMWFNGRAVLAGQMTLGDLFLYTFYVGLLVAPLVQIASISTQISEAFAGLDRIREIRQMTTEDDEDRERTPVAQLRGDVAFEHVSFEYTPGVTVLDDVSFAARAGTTTALVGSSGSGKSTLISLIMAFTHPRSGRILIDGRDLSTMRMREYRAHLGVVLQDNFLFDGTVAENIAFSKPGATMEEIREASRVAHADEFIEAFEKKYETIVGERGVRLSGGQRQRVAIARAILADPSILILDEATSSLDSESEEMIRDGLRALRQGRTTFVIAHRLSTIASADQILVLEGGRVVERGTQRELLALRGRYKQLYDKQYGAEKDQFINPGEDFTEGAEQIPVKVPVRQDSAL
jgi:ABC-type multidrug transport system fused ATPase/permease subunit